MKKIFIIFLISVICLNIWSQDTSKNEIRLIVRGDDFGMSHAGNISCIKAYKEGIVKSVEIMATCPWFPEAAKMLQENPGLDVGVHLVLTSEWENMKWRPLTNSPGLVNDDGYFYPMIWKNDNFRPNSFLIESNWKLKEIEKEWRAQIELAMRKIPRISHISGHMGCENISPKVLDIYKKVAADYNIDIHLDNFGVKYFPGYRGAKTYEDKVQKFIANLDSLNPGNWIFIEHPGSDDQEMLALGHIGYYGVASERNEVTKLFTDQRVKDAIIKKGIKLISYKDLRMARH